MILTQAQATIARDTHRFRVVNCGRRFGKTVLACEEILGVAIGGNDRRVSYYAPTREDARDIMWAMLSKRLAPIITYKNDSRLELKVKTQQGGESLIVLYGWEAVQERGKGRGLSNDFIVLDEVASYRNFWEGWNEVLSPTLIDRKGSALFISTPKGFNHFYDLHELEHKDPDYKSFHFTSYDNPNIPIEEIERERATKPEDVFAQEYLADFRKLEGLVYKEFNRDRDLIDDKTPLPQFYETILGVDFGYTNPACVLYIRKDFDNNYWILQEWYKTKQTTAQIIEQCKTYKPNVTYPDPAEPDRIEEMAKAGLNVREVSKDIANGIDAVRELFKQGKIRIHHSCLNLISELETYRYPEKKPDQNEKEVPIKERDHAMDALRYALYMSKPVEITTQDFQLYNTNFN